jgi:perosamine synthetase
MTEEIIPVFRPYYDQREIDAVAEVIQSGWTGLGPKTEQFEKEFGEKFYSNRVPKMRVVGMNSATAALDMALKLIGVNHGDEVIIPTITFVSTAHVVKYNLAEPIFVDVDPDTLNMDLDDVARKITKRTKAIIPVHYAGRAVHMHALVGLAGVMGNPMHPISIIEDCAHACGTQFEGFPVPYPYGTTAGCFSFHAVKNLSMGEGGALVCHDEEMYERAKRLRWLGIDKGTWDRTDKNRSYWWEYSVDEIGLKSHMDDIHAAMGLVQLQKIDEANRLRAERVRWYRDFIGDLEDVYLYLGSDKKASGDYFSCIKLPPDERRPGAVCSWHLFCVQTLFRDELSIYLKDKGIMTGVHYKPIHLYRCYGNTPRLPNAEEIFPTLLTLPLYPDLTRSQVSRICDTIREFFMNKGAMV